MANQNDIAPIEEDDSDDSIVFGLTKNDIGAIVVKTLITGALMTGIKVIQRKIDDHMDSTETSEPVVETTATEVDSE